MHLLAQRMGGLILPLLRYAPACSVNRRTTKACIASSTPAGLHDPIVAHAFDYLVTISIPEGGVHYALPSVNLYPHADWRMVEDNPPDSLNPTAALAGLLLKHHVQHHWVETASTYCWREIAASDSNAFSYRHAHDNFSAACS
jgi:hypothetical protein